MDTVIHRKAMRSFIVVEMQVKCQMSTHAITLSKSREIDGTFDLVFGIWNWACAECVNSLPPPHKTCETK